MAVGLGTGVPWVMCKEDDAPDPVVSEPSRALARFIPRMFELLVSLAESWRVTVVCTKSRCHCDFVKLTDSKHARILF
jgi:hypothetical protein